MTDMFANRRSMKCKAKVDAGIFEADDVTNG